MHFDFNKFRAAPLLPGTFTRDSKRLPRAKILAAKQDPKNFHSPKPRPHNTKQQFKATMMKQAAFFLALAASSASALELSPDNFAAETDGKSVLLKFFAPWVSNVFSSPMQHWQRAGLN